MLLRLHAAAAPYEVAAADGRRFAVFPVDGGFRVTDAACPHNEGPLAEGRLRDGAVHCPWHWYAFDLGSGACRTAPGLRLAVYPVVERDDGTFADVGEPAPVRSWAERLRAHARGEA